MMCAAPARNAAALRALERELPALAAFLRDVPDARPAFEELATDGSGIWLLRHAATHGSLAQLLADWQRGPADVSGDAYAAPDPAPDPARLAALEEELSLLRFFLVLSPTYRPLLESLAEMPNGAALLRHLVRSGALARWLDETAAEFDVAHPDVGDREGEP